MSLEDCLIGVAKASCHDRKIIILSDRGTMDGKAYMSKQNWEEMLEENDLTLSKIRDTRYDLVIHLSSAAVGA